MCPKWRMWCELQGKSHGLYLRRLLDDLLRRLLECLYNLLFGCINAVYRSRLRVKSTQELFGATALNVLLCKQTCKRLLQSHLPSADPNNLNSSEFHVKPPLVKD